MRRRILERHLWRWGGTGVTHHWWVALCSGFHIHGTEIAWERPWIDGNHGTEVRLSDAFRQPGITMEILLFWVTYSCPWCVRISFVLDEILHDHIKEQLIMDRIIYESRHLLSCRILDVISNPVDVQRCIKKLEVILLPTKTAQSNRFSQKYLPKFVCSEVLSEICYKVYLFKK
jgi:hypothetical protein